MEVSKELKNENIEIEVEVKEFDLALRKRIVGLFDGTTQKEIVNKNGISAIRELNDIDLDSLNKGTTATYKHRKDPVVVKTGDTVMYSIRIYNEGKQKGFATKIVDQLPKGLRLIFDEDENGNPIEIITSKKGYEYTMDFDLIPISDTYWQVKLNMTDDSKENAKNSPLEAYNGQTLYYDEIILKCKVEENPDVTGNNYKILTNVAYIAEEYNSETGETITTREGSDIDSTPAINPVLNNKLSAEDLKTTMEIGYTGGENFTEEQLLENVQTYYVGEQDDDDFEKVIILPETELTVQKIWEDNNDNSIRPTKIEIQLYADESLYGDSVELNKENNWTYTFENLPRYINGEEVNRYIVKELNENGEPIENGGILKRQNGGEYVVTYSEDGYTITNTEFGRWRG